MDLAQSLNFVMMKATIEAVPRTIIPSTSAQQKPITTKPIIKVEPKKEIKKEIKHKKEVKRKDNIKNRIKKEIKEVDIKINTKKEDDTPKLSEKVYEFNGVHLNIYDYFDLSPAIATKEEVNKMRKIHEWAFNKNNLSSAMAKIDNTIIKMGKTKIGYESLVKLYNHIRVRELR